MLLKKLINSLGIGFFRGSVLCCLFASAPTRAQIIPDNTLPQNSIATPQANTIQIDGGTRAGNNLFHSFEQFSVGVDETAHFNNAVEIQNILSRVTGRSISEINGILKANGVANLFLINPNGIVFGENASLDIGGSFFATSADSVVFTNGAEFRATNPNTPPLLTVNIPLGLWFRENPGSIVNRSVLTDDSGEDLIGLRVPPNQTLALVGGDILIEEGFLSTKGGRIELGSVAGNNFVNLTPAEQGWALNYQGIQNFLDITLTKAALVVSEGDRSGDIQVQGRRIVLLEGSQIGAKALVSGQAGNVIVRASESLELSGNSLDAGFKFSEPTLLFNEVEGEATGEGSQLLVETERLIVQNGAQISSNTFGLGQGADLTVRAAEVELEGAFVGIDSEIETFEPTSSGIFARVREEATGNGGTLRIDTDRLVVRDGAQISTSTFGGGNAGNLIVQASTIELIGTIPETNEPSALFANVDQSATVTGNGGNLTINTAQLILSDGAQIGTTAQNTGAAGILTINASESVLLSGTVLTAEPGETERSGVFISAEPPIIDELGNIITTTANAGELIINTPELIIEEGARISADNFGTGGGSNVDINVGRLIIRDGGQIGAGSLIGEEGLGNERGPGGTLTINASEAVEITGTGTVGSTAVNSRLFTLAEGTGDAGNLTIFTPNLTVTDGGEVNVSATGMGEAGSLTVEADSIRLENGSLSAETRVGTEGNITLNAQEIQLRRESEITTNSSDTGTGGNIEINSNQLVAIENSDISANAKAGSGGQVVINSDVIFGTQLRQQQTNASDITATSELGPEFSGTVELDSEIDPAQGLVELPQTVVDPAALIAQDVCKQGQGSEFINTGRGGIPPSPQESLRSEETLVGLIELPEAESRRSRRPSTVRRNTARTDNQPRSSADIIPARGWIRDENGDVILVSYDPTKTGVQRQRQPAIQCQP